MRLKALVKGALTLIPGAQAILPKAVASHMPPASYYYEVWLKHMAILRHNGLWNSPKLVAELGPGDALGTGIAILLSGIERYIGLDVVAHVDPARNIAMLDEIAELFRAKAPRPSKSWPDFDDMLDDRLFVSHILSDAVLAESLSAARVATIRDALAGGAVGKDSRLSYRAPWNDPGVVAPNSVDLILSQAVMEHVTDIDGTYRNMHTWLKPGGIMSHQIDMTCHGLTKEWNGYRATSAPVWWVTMGNRPYLINREPWSAHEAAIKSAGFEIVSASLMRRDDGISRARLAKKWRDISDADLNCADVFVQARKVR